MKILACIILFLLSTNLYAQTEKEFTVEVGWNGQRCVGDNGFCYVEPSADGNTILRLENNKLILKIYRNKITTEEEAKILGKELGEEAIDIYIMEEPFVLSKDITDQLLLIEGTLIPSGEYPVQITKDAVEIAFIMK